MTKKEILSAILLWSPVWCIPIQIIVSALAAYEGATRKWPVKTLVFFRRFSARDALAGSVLEGCEMTGQYFGIAAAAFFSTLYFLPMIIGNTFLFRDKPLIKKLLSFWAFSFLVLGIALGFALLFDYFG